MRKLAINTLYVALSIWAQTTGAVDQEIIDLGFMAWDLWERMREDGEK